MRLLRLTALLASALLTATACGPSSESPTAAGELTVWHYWDGANAQTFQALAQRYEQQHPGVKLKLVNVPSAEMLTKLQTGAASRTLPDLAIGDLVWVPRLAATGHLVDLKPLVPDRIWSDIFPEMLKFGASGDKRLSVPVSANTLAMLYNTDLFTQAGLDPKAPPATWEELRRAAKTILDKTGKPGFELFTQPGDSGEGLTWNFQVSLWQAGGEFLTPDNTRAAFNSEAGRKALRFWTDLVEDGSSPLGPWGAFEKGAAAAAQEGSWMVGIWKDQPPFPFAAAAIPHPEGGRPATNMGGEQAVVFDTAKDAKAAAAFLAWFSDQNLEWSKTTGFLPTRRSVAESQDYLASIDPLSKPFVAALPTARARPASPVYPKVSLAFAKQVEQALHGKKSVEAALADAEREVNAILAAGQ
ncbi:multiple sugar transport system substrate-binding protein [Thermocatellispora tengchongensis]|uniref:Multiple sugar transport system substrate-binding protein n=1 Tax=Thermocatellispora tengchongensis TaxID=1073253 RepID=A0A840NY53_9ACTN|nr:ABC transporter substrate-binding protein [Thermocatellispora tengchongensis]MBB5130591.1 multiple sugar transport system substrate-binding protein [Thermocatellispora tengchongensis]